MAAVVLAVSAEAALPAATAAAVLAAAAASAEAVSVEVDGAAALVEAASAVEVSAEAMAAVSAAVSAAAALAAGAEWKNTIPGERMAGTRSPGIYFFYYSKFIFRLRAAEYSSFSTSLGISPASNTSR